MRNQRHLTGLIRFRSVPRTQRPQPVRVVDASGNFLGTSTHGYITEYNFRSVRKHQLTVTKLQVLDLFLSVAFIGWLTLLGGVFATFASTGFRVALGIAFAASIFVRYLMVDSLLESEMVKVAVADRKGSFEGVLVCVREEDWPDWKRKVDPYGLQNSGLVD